MSRRLAAAIRGEGIVLGCPLPSSDSPVRRRACHKKVLDEKPPGPDGIGVIDCCILKSERETLVQPNAPVNAPPWVMPCNY